MSQITRANVSSHEVARILTKLANVLDEEPREAAVIGCISMALLAQNPQLTTAQLIEGVHVTSGAMAIYLHGVDDDNPQGTVQ